MEAGRWSWSPSNTSTFARRATSFAIADHERPRGLRIFLVLVFIFYRALQNNIGGHMNLFRLWQVGARWIKVERLG